MSGAELRASREALGLTLDEVAVRVDRSLREVQRWEAGQRGIPNDVRDTIHGWAAWADTTVENAAEHAVPGTTLEVPRNGSHDGWPAATWRIIAHRIARTVPNLRIHYREE